MSLKRFNIDLIEPPLSTSSNAILRYLSQVPQVTWVTEIGTSGYTSGGILEATSDIIDKFPFSTDTNASDVGDLTQARGTSAGQSSKESGYISGGGTPFFPTVLTNIIDKFPFATNSNASDVGDLTQSRIALAGQSSTVSGYSSGGSSTSPPKVYSNVIDKFPFAADANASDVGDLSFAREERGGQNSVTHGYTSGGLNPAINVIDRFPFASDANATDVGDLTQTRYGVTGQSSVTHGYASGGGGTPASLNTIDRFPFATNANASNVGALTLTKRLAAGQSSSNNGYTSGGLSGPGPRLNTIDKFPFAVEANATDVGDLTQERFGPVGQQV